MNRKFSTLFTLVASGLLVTACGSNDGSSPTTPTSSASATVEINGLTASSGTWGNGYRTSLHFNLIERGGVAIVVDSLNVEVSDGTTTGTCTWNSSEVSSIFASNRIGARQNRYGDVACDSPTARTSAKVMVGWNDDNLHRGVATATASVQ